MTAIWRFFPEILPFLILRIFLLSCEGEITTGAPSKCIHDLTGAVDIVFVMDRSTSVDRKNFTNMHTIAGKILEKTTISPDNARVAVVSFGSNVTLDVNYISRDEPVYECEFYHNLGAFNTQVSYVAGGSDSKTEPLNQEINEALDKSKGILETGKKNRPNVGLRQFMWIMTDYHEFDEDSTSDKLGEITNALNKTGVFFLFGTGIGKYHNHSESEALQQVISQPPRCYYDKLPEKPELRTELQWKFIPPGKIRPGEWRNVTQAKICQEITGCSSCRCKESGEDKFNSTYECVENGTGDHPWQALKFVFFGVGGLAVLVLIISLICYCCCCGRTTRRPEQEPPKAEGQEDKEEEPEDEGNTENHYQNSIVVEIWNQATLDSQTRIPESDSPPTSPEYIEAISAPPSPPVSTPRITHQYLTQRREGNPQTRGEYADSNARFQGQPPPSANGHCRRGRVCNPSYEDQSPSVHQGSNFMEEFQKKWQQIRKTVVSTVRLKTIGKRHRQSENEGTIEDISRRFHDNSQNGSTNPQTGASDEPTRSNNNSQLESRKSRWSFWPFHRSTAKHYENENTIEEISRRYHEHNGPVVQEPGASGGLTSNNNTNSQSESRKSRWSFWPFHRSTTEHYENEDTIEEISRRYHEHNGSAVQGPVALGSSTSNNNTNSQSESRKSDWSLWPFRKSTAQHYENEETIEKIRRNKKTQDRKNTKRGPMSFKRLLRTFERNTDVEGRMSPDDVSTTPDVSTIQTSTPGPVSPGLLSPNRAPCLELI